MAPHGGGVEDGTEQMARYIYNELVSDGKDVALWVNGGRNTACNLCEDENCENICHHVTSNTIDPNCDPYLKEILTNCKTGIALHGCSGGCPSSPRTDNNPPVLVGGRAEYEFKQRVANSLNNNLGSTYYIINFDDVRDCKYYLPDGVSCYRGIDHCNVANQFPKFNFVNGLPGIQVEMPPEMRADAEVSIISDQCKTRNPPAECLTRYENENIYSDTLTAADAYVQAIKDYITYKGW